MSVAAILTGKGGSKLKDKNILMVDGKPCLYFPCMAAKEVKKIDHFFVSSENKKILKYAKNYGYNIINRPKKLSKANSQHIDVIIHALKHLEKKAIKPKILVILLANAPIIYSSWIRNCINILQKNKLATSVVPVIQNNDHHPMRAKKIKNGFLTQHNKIKAKISTNRQDLVSNYFLCHNFWVIRTENIYSNNGELPWKFLGKKVLPYKVSNSIDIHEKEDIYLANIIRSKNFKLF